jgi:hypothetical protein
MPRNEVLAGRTSMTVGPERPGSTLFTIVKILPPDLHIRLHCPRCPDHALNAGTISSTFSCFVFRATGLR